MATRLLPKPSLKLKNLTLTLTLLLVIPSTASPYALRTTSEGIVVRWQDEAIDLVLDQSLLSLGGPGAANEIIEAAATWQDSGYLPVHFNLSEGEADEVGFFGDRENHNSVLASRGSWPYSPDYTAVTISTFDAATGRLLDADVVFDATRSWNTGETPGRRQIDVRDTATHELGHLLGLEHSELQEATMYPVGAQGSTDRRSLDADDVEALLAAYGQPPSLGREVEAGCSAIGGAPQADSAIPMLLLAFALIRRRK